MREYLVSAVAVCALCALADTLFPDGKLKKEMSFALSLVVVLVLVSPLFSALSNIDEMGQGFISELEDLDTQHYEGELYDVGERLLEEGIARTLCERFSLSESELGADATISFIGDELLVERVEISLSGSAIFSDIHEIKKYVQRQICDECEVILLEF